jgi:predicted nucleic acid-binding protein
VKKCKLDVPNGLAIIYGDMWKALKIKLHYSEVDNDDTLAAYAQKHKASVLSGDKDFYRYRDGTFPIYSDYEIVMGRL